MIQMLKCASTTAIEHQTSTSVLRHLMNCADGTMLSNQDLNHIESFHWSIRNFDKGGNISAQSEPRTCVSVLLSGWAFRFQTLADGKRQILDFIFAGALLGFGNGNTHPYGVEAITKCTVASLQTIQFRRMLSGCASLALHVAERVVDSEMRAHEHLTSLGRRSARERIAALIVELMVRTPIRFVPETGGKLELPITQIMIGDALGLSNEHVCRTLAKLVDAGLIELSRNALYVLNPKAVADEAGKSFSELTVNTALEYRAA